MRKNSGFTTMELMVAAAIVGVLTAFSIPAIIEWLPDYRLKIASRELYSNAQSAKLSAIKQNQDWAIAFEEAGNKYEIYSIPRGSTPAEAFANNTAVLEKRVNLGDYGGGVRFGHGNATTKATTTGGGIDDNISFTDDRAVFNPRGTGLSGYVYLENSKGETSYAFGTFSSGVIKLKKWGKNATAWE